MDIPELGKTAVLTDTNLKKILPNQIKLQRPKLKVLRTQGLQTKNCRLQGFKGKKIRTLGFHRCTPGLHFARINNSVRDPGSRPHTQKFLGSRTPKTPLPPPLSFWALKFFVRSPCPVFVEGRI